LSSDNAEKYWLTDILLLTLLIGIAFAFLLGSRSLNVPDEARYCEIAREMLVTHDFITPRLNGILYFEKPALFYWMQAFSLHIFGLSEWACRLMDALMALLGCIATYFTARKLFDRKTGLFSAVVLASSLLYFALARVITLDMTLSIWLSLALFGFILGTYNSRFYYYFLYIFAAFAVLTKGLIGIILPASIIFFWMLFTQQWKILSKCYLIRGIFIFLLITVPWHILVQLKNPEFFHFYFIEQQFNRYLTMNAHRYQPAWYYIPILLLGFFPWTGFLVGAIKRIKSNNNYHKELFFLIGAMLIFIFFSLSKSKLVPYVLPCFPLLAILIGRYFSEEKPKYLSLGFFTSSLISVIVAIAIPFFLTSDITLNFESAQNWSYVVMTILLLNAVIIPWIFYKKKFISAFIMQTIFAVLFLFSLSATVPYIYMDSVKTMALHLKSQLKPNDMIAVYDLYYQDLPFYLEKYITIINWDGELDFGYHYAHAENLWMNEKTFWPYWQSNKTVYLMISKELLNDVEERFPQYHFYLEAETKNDILVTNHEGKL
jgi:4-amino-4-deoxy-L-arabinose transferase-like glycosyltransferase